MLQKYCILVSQTALNSFTDKINIQTCVVMVGNRDGGKSLADYNINNILYTKDVSRFPPPPPIILVYLFLIYACINRAMKLVCSKQENKENIVWSFPWLLSHANSIACTIQTGNEQRFLSIANVPSPFSVLILCC